MPAFNARLKPKEVFGMPMMAAFGLVVALICGVLSLMLPWVLKLFTVPLALAGGVAAGVAFWQGDELPWLGVKRLSAIENNRVTSEVEGIE